MEKIKIATLNVRGFATSKEKREHIFQFILQNKIDITLLTETNVKEVHIPLIKPNGLHLQIQSRSLRQQKSILEGLQFYLVKISPIQPFQTKKYPFLADLCP